MLIVHDPQCADYGSSLRPEQPARITKSAAHLRSAHPDWEWRVPEAASDDLLLLAHTPAHLERLKQPYDFDDDTPFFPGIGDHARRAVGAAILAAEHALASRGPAFSLMRPPGHHATGWQAMGFCYLNSIAIAALHARQNPSAERVAIWDFDAHHGNGTEAILHGREGLFFASVHQSPGYPGTGTSSFENCHNWPVPPQFPRDQHMAALRESFERVVSFAPRLILVSAGFDAYEGDPITSMTLKANDFATLGRWLSEIQIPAAAILEGGYSDDLPLLIDAFLSAWKK
jgi:acetoin utilization deacetylase AcuC-like enzyme